MNPEMTAALAKLLATPATSGAVLPLIARWDTSGAMGAAVKSQIESLTKILSDAAQPAARRVQAAQSLLGVRSANGAAVAAVGAALQNSGADVAAQLIAALGETDDSASAAQLIAAYPKLSPPLQAAAYDQLIKRADWSRQVLEAIKSGQIKAADLGPANVARLRNHPDKSVARAANAMLDQLLSPAMKEKNAVIARLTPEVEKPGDAAKGKALFAACAICHQLGGEGKLVGPPLTGMGAHAPADLLVHIVDPNREVDPSFFAWNITKKNGETLVGIIASENQAAISLRTQAGDFEIRKDEIAKRENTQKSLMPEGFEALGAEVLRDLLAYIGATETRFRIVDLKNAYTADNRRGLFNSEEAVTDTVSLAKTGNVTVEGVPFFLMDAAKSASGANLIVLRGGPRRSFSGGMPQKIEAPVGVEAKKFHLLSGIAGWGFPAVRDEAPVLRMTLNFADGQTDKFEFSNGVEFADYNREIEVPGSKLASGVVTRGQLRLISVATAKKGVVKSLTLESLHPGVAPVVVAVTADIPGAGPEPRAKARDAASSADKPVSAAPAPPAAKPARRLGENEMPEPQQIQWEKDKTKVLIVAGGSSHDFRKWFEDFDTATLKAAGFSVNWTENAGQAAQEIKNADVALVSVNRGMFDTAVWREALFAHLAAGKGVVMLHPGTWYGYPTWPELNAKVVGGGAKGHDPLGPFQVKVLKPEHPILKGVPASFEVIDELYYMNSDPPPKDASAITVLAETSPSKRFNQPHPSVWITAHDKARIANIALGHDGRVHELPAFKAILTNAAAWAAKK
jgi:putative heme-binding domain-containing protein